MKLKSVLSLLILLTGLHWSSNPWSSKTLAHAVLMEATPIPSFQVQVRYESGEPMANAQVNVYAPSDPQTAWLQTITDENGYFLFTPDPEIPGTWDIQARLAGHGKVLQINVQDDGAIRQMPEANTTPLQKWLMVAAVVWGLVGTALFFTGRQSPQHPAATPDRSRL